MDCFASLAMTVVGTRANLVVRLGGRDDMVRERSLL
jgi:hypothetical protein